MQKVKMKNYYKNKRFKDKMVLCDLSCVRFWCFGEKQCHKRVEVIFVITAGFVSAVSDK